MKNKLPPIHLLKMTLFSKDKPLLLECGKTLGPIEIAYETYGTLNEKKSNTILICHALSGDSHAAGLYKNDPENVGWWDWLIGPNKAIDTNKYFVICSNVLGGCKGSTGPSSINPKTNKPYGLDFPILTISDMVNAQKELISSLEIKKLKMIIGGSMGGMQAMEWAIQFPEMVESCIPIASTHQLSPQAIAFDAVGRHAILKDEKNGLPIARMIGHITYVSTDSMNKKFGRRLQKKTDYGYDFDTDFQIESYLKYQGDKFATRFDAHTYLYITKALSYFDLSKKHGSLLKAFESVSAKFLVIAIDSDWLYPSAQSKAIVKTLIKLNKEVTYCELNSKFGHDAFLLENQDLKDIVSNYLEQNKIGKNS